MADGEQSRWRHAGTYGCSHGGASKARANEGVAAAETLCLAEHPIVEPEKGAKAHHRGAQISASCKGGTHCAHLPHGCNLFDSKEASPKQPNDPAADGSVGNARVARNRIFPYHTRSSLLCAEVRPQGSDLASNSLTLDESVALKGAQYGMVIVGMDTVADGR